MPKALQYDDSQLLCLVLNTKEVGWRKSDKFAFVSLEKAFTGSPTFIYLTGGEAELSTFVMAQADYRCKQSISSHAKTNERNRMF